MHSDVGRLWSRRAAGFLLHTFLSPSKEKCERPTGLQVLLPRRSRRVSLHRQKACACWRTKGLSSGQTIGAGRTAVRSDCCLPELRVANRLRRLYPLDTRFPSFPFGSLRPPKVGEISPWNGKSHSRAIVGVSGPSAFSVAGSLHPHRNIPFRKGRVKPRMARSMERAPMAGRNRRLRPKGCRSFSFTKKTGPLSFSESGPCSFSFVSPSARRGRLSRQRRRPTRPQRRCTRRPAWCSAEIHK